MLAVRSVSCPSEVGCVSMVRNLQRGRRMAGLLSLLVLLLAGCVCIPGAAAFLRKLRSNRRVTAKKALASPGLFGSKDRTDALLFGYVCEESSKLMTLDNLASHEAVDITRAVFAALRSEKTLPAYPKIEKLVRAANDRKGDDSFFQFKNSNHAVSLNQLLCKARDSAVAKSRQVVMLKQEAAQSNRFLEQHRVDQGMQTRNATSLNTMPYLGKTICINQKDGTVCDTAPLGLCCHQRCVRSRTFATMCPRLCPETASDGESCALDAIANTPLSSQPFCCSRRNNQVDGAALQESAAACVPEKDFELRCGSTATQPKVSAFSPSTEKLDAAFAETKKYWDDRKAKNLCAGKSDGADCTCSVKSLPLTCCRETCVSQAALKVQCPGVHAAPNKFAYQSAFPHRDRAPKDPRAIANANYQVGTMPAPYFSRAMNHTVMNRVPPPVASLPPTQPSEHELHPIAVGAEIVKDDNGGIRVHTNTGIQGVKPAADGVSDMPTKLAGGNTRPVSFERRGHVEPRSYTEYDPYPTRNPVCPVTYVTIKREDNIIDGVTPKDVAQHVGRYTGVWDIHADNKFVQAQLYAPSRLPFARLEDHFFADMDGRYTFAAMMTPGGDIGEFIGAACALEKSRSPKTRLLTLPDVRSLLHGWLQTTGEKRKKFFMQTDSDAMSRFEKAVGIDNFLHPDKIKLLDAEDIKVILSMAAVPEHVGSIHLRNMLQFADEYGCRSSLTEYAITSFFELLLATKDPLSAKLVYHVAHGYHEESAVLDIYAVDGECPSSVPLVVSGVRADADAGVTPITSAFVLHRSAVNAFRQELAQFFAARASKQVKGAKLLSEMNKIGKRTLLRTLTRAAPQLPRFSVFFTQNPF